MTTSQSNPHTPQQFRHPHWSLALLLSVVVSIALFSLYLWLDAQNRYPRTYFTSTKRLNTDILVWYHIASLVGIWSIAILSGFSFWKYVSLPLLHLRAPVAWLVLVVGVPSLGFSLLLCVAIAFFGAYSSVGLRTTVGIYQVSLAQTYDYDPYASSTLWLIVIREDGAYYSEVLDQRTNRESSKTSVCTTLSVQQVDDRVYFRCDNEGISSRTPYVDTYKQTLYLGWGKAEEERSLDKLPFYQPYRRQCWPCPGTNE